MLIEVSELNFNELLNSGKPMVLDFWAEWCGPCRMVAPIIDTLAEEYDGKVTVGKLNVDNDSTISSQYEVRSIPTVIFFKNGQEVDRSVGAAPRAVFIEKVEALLK